MSGIAIAGVVIAGVSAGISFSQARDAENTRKRAVSDAKTKMDSARAELEKNFMASLSVPLEAYELEKEALLVAGATVTDAAEEGDPRGVGAVANRVLQATQAQAAAQRTSMAQDLFNLDAATAEEESRLRDIGVSLTLNEVEGAKATAANAAMARANANMQGIQSAGSAVQQGFQAAPLYKANRSATKAAAGNLQFTPEQFNEFGNVVGKNNSMGPAGGKGFTNLDLSKISNMSNSQFRQFKRDLTPAQKQMLFNTPQFYQNYNDALDPMGDWINLQQGTTIER